MTRALTVAVLAVVMVTMLHADDPPKLQTLQGTVDKLEKDTLTIRHKTEKAEKAVAFKLTGTSRFSALSTRKTGDKVVLVQKDIDAKALVEKQSISVIYATNAGDHVLLSAVVQAE